MGQPTSSRDVLRALTQSTPPPAAPAVWTCDAVAATFLRRGELVPPAQWSILPGASTREMEVAGELVAASRAKNTRKAYGRHVQSWLDWARTHEVCPLPAASSDLQLYLVERAIDFNRTQREATTGRVNLEGRLVMATVTQIMSALSRLHSLADLPTPSQDPRIQELMAGLRRTLVQAPRGAKAALTWDLLTEVLNAPQDAPTTASELRTRLAQEISAATGASAGQLARLLRSDLSMTADKVVVVLAPSRRGGPQLRHEIDVESLAGRLLARWLRTTKHWPGTAVFRDREGKTLTRQGLHKILKMRPVVVSDEAVAETVSPAQVRDRALLLTGWTSALRRSNLAALTWNDLTRTDAGWTAYIARSKTDQQGRGTSRAIPTAPPGSTIPDPAGALDDWLGVVTATLGFDPRRLKGVPVFVRIDRYGRLRLVNGRPVGLSGSGISEIVKRRVRAAGLEDRQHPTRDGLWSELGKAFAAHSLRAGFVTEGFRRQLDPTEISAVTGHTSLRALLGYNRPEQSADMVAASTLLTALGDASGQTASEASPRRAERRRGPNWDVALSDLGAER